MEVVQRRMENMSNEIQQMRRTKLFTYDECKEILKMRKQFEYKINGITKHLQDFKDYINYEKGLLKAVRLRRNSLKIGEKMGDIEHKIISRIKGLYETTLQRFPDNTTLSLIYFNFLKSVNYTNAASVAISNMIKNHSDVAEIWQVAAKWHAYDQNNINIALKVLRKGLAKHKTSKLLYTEVIHLEVQNVEDYQEKSINDTELSENQKLCLKKLQIYLKEIYAFINDCEYYIDLVNYFDGFSFTASIQRDLIEYLAENYSSEALTWNMLAQRDRRGLQTPTNDKCAITSPTVKLKNCINRYKEGLAKVSTSEKGKLWSYYINCLIDSKEEDYGITSDFGANCLIEAFIEASIEDYLNEEHYVQWSELVNDDEKVQIIQKGIVKFPQSIELWKTYLKFEITFGDTGSIDKVFQEGIKTLKEKALPLWTGIIGYHLSKSDDDAVDAYYSKGVQQAQEVSDILKPHYLEWTVAIRGIECARKQYSSMADKRPYCKELHLTMIKLESEQPNPDFNIWDNVHKLVCEQFGSDDIYVWLNRIEYYLQHRLVSKDVIQSIYVNASKSLSESAFSTFKEKYYAMLDR